MTTPPAPGNWFVTSNGPLDSTLTGSLASNAIQWATSSPFNHAGLCVDARTVIEAQPGGARRSPIDGYLGANTVWSTGYALTAAQRTAIVAAAVTLLGTPYGWGDIAAIALAQQRLGRFHRIDALIPYGRQPWWVRRLARPDRLICSQLVDLAHLLGGVHLFADGRPSGLCSPGDLGRLLTVGG